MSPAKRRQYLGGTRGFGFTERVYAVPGALEIDEHDGYDIRRRRVFYDDVLMVTRHKMFGWPYLIMSALFAAMFTLMAISLATDRDTDAQVVGLFVFLLTGCPFIAAFLIRIFLKLDVVTVFGKRTKAVMKYAIRKGKCAWVMSMVCQNAKDKQDELAESLRAKAEAEGAGAPAADMSSVPAEFRPPTEDSIGDAVPTAPTDAPSGEAPLADAAPPDAGSQDVPPP